MKKKALISVSDKTGVVNFAKELVNLGYEIISSGGTSKLLRENKIEAIEVSDYTDFPECFEGRIKTLHPRIEGGILFKRTESAHQESAKALGIKPIDIVVCNLYPFRETLNSEASDEQIIENIDIGGPTMLRAAAKNYQDVAVIIYPSDYDKIIEELKLKKEISLETKKALAGKVFNHTAQYDAMIARYFNTILGISYPDQLTLTYDKIQDLRYGENPHQKAAFYKQTQTSKGLLTNAEQLHGKELSYNNISDANGGLETLKEFSEPTVVAIKHGTACGVGSSTTLSEAYQKAYEADPVSIFGGIVLANRIIDKATAAAMSQIFLEVIIAPDYSEEAYDILTKKKNVRILRLKDIERNNEGKFVAKTVLGGLLLQDADRECYNEEELEVVTQKQPTEDQMQDLFFAWKMVKHAKSNGIVLAKNKQSIGIGSGQVSRIGALDIAARQAGEKAKGGVLASDAFFPFPDCVELAGKIGISAIIQPGGSIKDRDSVDKANELGIAMVFTHQRHFKH